ncbi:hypothetical protein [Streptomyces sp. NPDC001980]|uniref:hypothetical protein n=1 Tax=Streptomyces sp. NPDC001980 TaxID=3157126 RepID=UPI0033282278
MSEQFRTAWAAFATDGSPGRPAYDPDRRLVQVMHPEPAVTAYPGETSRRLWQHHTFDTLPLLGAGG